MTDSSLATKTPATDQHTTDAQNDIAAIMKSDAPAHDTNSLTSMRSEGINEFKNFLGITTTKKTVALQETTDHQEDSLTQAMSGSSSRADTLDPHQITFAMQQKEQALADARQHKK